MKNMIDMRFGFGTWQEILKLRADRIREEQEEEKRLARERRKKKAEIMETMQIIAIAGGGVLVVFAICFAVLSIWLR